MKLNRKHLHALDIGIHKTLEARDNSTDQNEQNMLGLNAQRLRQLRILLIKAFIDPTFSFTTLCNEGLDETTDFVKGIRTLTGHCETDTE